MHSEPQQKFLIMYSYVLKVAEHDEAFRFMLGTRQTRQKKARKVWNIVLGIH